MKACTKDSKEKSLVVGSLAPDFSLNSQNGESVSLSSFREKKNVVLYFYPKDNTRGCIVESSTFRDQYTVFQNADTEVIGVSSDDQASHQKFINEFRLPFILLSDIGGHVRKLYKVPATFGIIPGRVTFVIDKKGIIRHIFSSQFNPKSHVDQALKILKEL